MVSHIFLFFILLAPAITTGKEVENDRSMTEVIFKKKLFFFSFKKVYVYFF